MRYFKRKWNETRGDQFDDWGTSMYFLETEDSGLPSRQIEKYDNGIVLKYGSDKKEDAYGGLGGQELDLAEFNEYEILKADFEKEWKTKVRQFLISKSIGVLFQDEQFDDWWEAEPREIPFFDNKKMKITFMNLVWKEDSKFIEEADQALERFLLKTELDRKELSEILFKYCIDFLDLVDYEDEDGQLRQILDKNDIWNYVYPQEIFVERRHRRDENIYINLACECEWEKEHGLQLVFRQGRRLTRVSEQDGHLTESDAYDLSDKEDKLLHAYKKELNEKPWWKRRE
ncbi:DUF6985 domain-containing protein [Marinifilum breve]|uniref:DUF6985 domain-containing protein n=1 Tax=Marinifilum breve TaxID=2184082 RepID=UPI001A9C93DB|nr:hypothetical protein [Marinifilum breve]